MFDCRNSFHNCVVSSFSQGPGCGPAKFVYFLNSIIVVLGGGSSKILPTGP